MDYFKKRQWSTKRTWSKEEKEIWDDADMVEGPTAKEVQKIMKAGRKEKSHAQNYTNKYGDDTLHKRICHLIMKR